MFFLRGDRLLALLLASALAACVRTAPAPTPVDAALPARGRVVAARVISTAQAGQFQVISAALASPDAASDSPITVAASNPSIEYVVREDDGRTVSLVQSGVGEFRIGQSVLVVPARLPGESPGLLPAP